MGFRHVAEVAVDEEMELYYKLEEVSFDKQPNGLYIINCNLVSYTERNGQLVGTAPVILLDVDLDEEGNIMQQVYIAAKKEYFIDFDDELDGGL